MNASDAPLDGFYEMVPSEELLQGDIFLCPSSYLRVDGPDAAPRVIPAGPDAANDIGKDFFVPAWQHPVSESGAPGVVHVTRWGAVMVLSHECELQKDWNALRRHLINAGMSPDEAIQHADAREDIDRFVVVSPLLPYPEFLNEWPEELRTEQRLADARRGQRVSSFPLPPHPTGLWPDVVVSLGRAATIDRALLTPDGRLASLTASARGVLRHKLERTYATRDLSVLDELEAAIGQTIVDVTVQPLEQKKGERKQVQMVIHLANGDVLHLHGAPIRPAPAAAPARGVGRALED